jgi:hypothetical protein
MKKQIFKFIFDLAMAILFVLLFPLRVTGLTFHEIVGIIIGIAILIHIAINGKWVVQTAKKIFSRKLPTKTRISALLNLLLLICAIFFVVSGLLISRVVLPDFRYLTHLPWRPIHEFTSYLGLILIGVHIGLHWDWIKNILKQKVKTPKTSFTRNLAKFVTYLLLVVGTIGLFGSIGKTIGLTGRVFFSNPKTFSHGEHGRGHHGDFEKNFTPRRDFEGRRGERDHMVRDPRFNRDPQFDRRREMIETRHGRGERGDWRGERRGRRGGGDLLSWISTTIFYLSQFGALAFYTHLIERWLRKRKTAKADEKVGSAVEEKPIEANENVESTVEEKPTEADNKVESSVEEETAEADEKVEAPAEKKPAKADHEIQSAIEEKSDDQTKPDEKKDKQSE